MTVSNRARIRTHPERAVPDEAEEILEKGLLAHVGFVVDGQPYVIPMLYHYEENVIYIHGQRGGRLPRTLRAGDKVCVEMTIVWTRTGFGPSYSMVTWLLESGRRYFICLPSFLMAASSNKSLCARSSGSGM